MKRDNKSFEKIIGLNLLALGLLGSGYAAKLMVQDVSRMHAIISQPKLKPMPQAIDFKHGQAIVRK